MCSLKIKKKIYWAFFLRHHTTQGTASVSTTRVGTTHVSSQTKAKKIRYGTTRHKTHCRHGTTRLHRHEHTWAFYWPSLVSSSVAFKWQILLKMHGNHVLPFTLSCVFILCRGCCGTKG